MTITNIQHFLVENEEGIVSIPSLEERIRALEVLVIPRLEPVTYEPVDFSDPVVDEFDQGDHDEIFADGGETERSHDTDDDDELFADGGATDRSFDGADWAELHQVPIAANPTFNHPNI